MALQRDYLERVYAGVLGKVIGVYLGVPFEGWPREKIVSDLGQVRYYVHEKIASSTFPGGKQPLLVADDDVAGTFFSVRALEEHGARILSAEEIGKTWLNNVIEGRTVFWWGGVGISTEHTAYLNLKNGIPGGPSGSIKTNGEIVAQQIGGEIFIDAWAMCSPGRPDLAAKLAHAAASVSHDGESVYGAVMWAVMEAEAFQTKDVDRLIDMGLKYIPNDCVVARAVSDIRNWAKQDNDWRITRQRIEDNYGNDKFDGFCHVVPNHSLKILALVYGGHSFHEGLSILVTCGWDTDSNGGNMGALLGIMHGLAGFEGGPDWRGPLHDRTLISTADGGYGVNNCARIAYDIARAGYKLSGNADLEHPKNYAQYHFTLPGSVQGFRTIPNSLMPCAITLEQGQGEDGPGLAIKLRNYSVANDPAEVMTDTFMPDYCLPQSHYHMMASPLVYPGQNIVALLYADEGLPAGGVDVCIRIKVNTHDATLRAIDSMSCHVGAGKKVKLEFKIPDDFDCQPIQQIGLVVKTDSVKSINSTLWLDYVRFDGSPKMRIARPKTVEGMNVHADEPWRRAWIDNASTFPPYFPHFLVTQSQGEGGVYYGTRDWTNYRVDALGFMNYTKGPNGIAIRVQGINRWYALLFRPGRLSLIKALDEKRHELAATEYQWSLNKPHKITIAAQGDVLKAYVDDILTLEARDGHFVGGGIGIIVTEGSASVDEFIIEPLE